MGQSGRRRIEENFKIERNVNQIEEVYHELIADKN
jgi:glycosyltransferase involved in cell wall biosynthesis